MGATCDDFIQYPRTPHLFGSKGSDDDKHLNRRASETFTADPSLVVEDKLDGTNVGIHFTMCGRMELQCHGHEITEGMHPQYDLFKQWTSVKHPVLEAMLGSRFIFYGEWLYAKHSAHYRALLHYFFEFDIYDKDAAQFHDLATRLRILEGNGLYTLPVLHRGAVTANELRPLIGPSAFDNPVTGRTDHLMEGLYMRTETGGHVTDRVKMVRPEFVEKVNQNQHWQHQTMVPNQLRTEKRYGNEPVFFHE